MWVVLTVLWLVNALNWSKFLAKLYKQHYSSESLRLNSPISTIYNLKFLPECSTRKFYSLVNLHCLQNYACWNPEALWKTQIEPFSQFDHCIGSLNHLSAHFPEPSSFSTPGTLVGCTSVKGSCRILSYIKRWSLLTKDLAMFQVCDIPPRTKFNFVVSLYLCCWHEHKHRKLCCLRRDRKFDYYWWDSSRAEPECSEAKLVRPKYTNGMRRRMSCGFWMEKMLACWSRIKEQQMLPGSCWSQV